MQRKERANRTSVLTHIGTDQLHRNPNNPRILFDPEPLRILRESIAEVGILVPLLVYQRKTDEEYVILDGERRWMCAKELGLELIPANIIEEPSLIQNLLTMFNIHNIREPWDLMPTALKLEVVIRQLRTDSEAKLSKLTGLTRINVRRCKIILSYDKSYQDMMLTVDPEQRIKADFFIEMYPVIRLIRRRIQTVSDIFPGNKLIDTFLDKYLQQKMTSVLDFRKIASFIRSIDKGTSQVLVESKLLDFLQNEDSTLTEVLSDIEIIQKRESIKRTCKLLIGRLSTFELSTESSDAEIKGLLLELKAIIDTKLKSIES